MLDAPHNKFYTALRHRTDVLLHTLLWWLLAGVSNLGFFLPPRHPRYRRDRQKDTELGYRKLLSY